MSKIVNGPTTQTSMISLAGISIGSLLKLIFFPAIFIVKSFSDLISCKITMKEYYENLQCIKKTNPDQHDITAKDHE